MGVGGGERRWEVTSGCKSMHTGFRDSSGCLPHSGSFGEGGRGGSNGDGNGGGGGDGWRAWWWR